MKKLLIAVFGIILIASVAAFFIFRGGDQIKKGHLKSAEHIIGLEFTPEEREMMLEGLERNLSSYEKLRSVSLANHVPPALLFDPIGPAASSPSKRQHITLSGKPDLVLPDKLEEVAFWPLSKLALLIQQKKITSLQLTELYLARLKKYGPELKCMVTLTEDLAREQARRADQELAAGRYRGPLHGIPWGAKDLLSTKGIKTTWGAMPYKDQVLDVDATVVKRLEEAGAILVAKLSMGALAMGDYWFEGKTLNPWNLEQGSSGSSAGSAAATAAGLVGFSIGTETLGSIVSPATRCGVTGLRPTFGRVSRYGAMALSWSMDKIGPICRTVQDCALVFNAIYGPDGLDLTVRDYPFVWDPQLDISSLRVAYLKEAFEKDNRNRENDEASLEILRSLGVELHPLELPDLPVEGIYPVLSAEAAAAFDELTRSGKDDLLVRQNRGAWPNSFRRARFIPAVEYIQANRLRTLLMQEMAKLMRDIDVYLAPTSGRSNNLLVTNLTGHPCVVVPNGFNDKGSPTSITFIGDLFGEAQVLRLAQAYQEATEFHREHPDLDANIASFKAKQAREQ
jgi:Asp-tRNA(Asn)/Glu-tRNA(Gln) amidotransferase A subunit family amidase